MISESSLRKISLLKDLNSTELSNLGQVLIERRIPKGSYVVYADDPAKSLMFIAEGELKVSLKSTDNKEVIVAQLEEGDFFGELALLLNEDRSANVVATADCVIYVLPAEQFEAQILMNSGLALAMLKELAARLKASTVKIGDLALYDVYRRIFRTLASLGVEKDGGREIEKRPTHQELAAMAGTSREMVTRALKGLEEDGYISSEGRKIKVIRELR